MAAQSTLGGSYRHSVQGLAQSLRLLLMVVDYKTKGPRARLQQVLAKNKPAAFIVVAALWIAWRNLRFYVPSRSVAADGRPNASVRPDGRRELWVPYKGKLRQVLVHPTKQSTFDSHRRLFLAPRNQYAASKKHKSKGIATSRFTRELRAILSILIPRYNTKVVGFIILHAFLLGLRTYLSLIVANLDGRIVRDMIAANGRGFLTGIAQWLALAVPASYTNAMIHYIQGKISLEFRTKLIRYIHDLYIAPGMEYYKLSNIDGQIEGADHYITSDLNRFCDRAASLFSSLGKPLVDMLFFSYQLSNRLGPTALTGIFLNYGITAYFLKRVSPPFGKLAARETALEGEYRNAHARLITNAEEIAFYDGASIERASLTTSFNKLSDHIMKLLRIRAYYNIVEDFILKYSWSASGFVFAAFPVFFPLWSGQAQSIDAPSGDQSGRERSRMGNFVTDKRMMLSVADAGGRLMYSIKDLAELAGYTQRIFELISALHRVRANAYKELAHERFDGETPEYSLADVEGTVQYGFDGFRLEDTPIIVPGLGHDLTSGEKLVDPISFRINPGDHLLITGANGVGKTSIARIAAGLWPVYRGLLSEPGHGRITFLPQRPYFSTGTLRDQVIYPFTHSTMLESGRTDAELDEILRLVKLDYLPQREGGYDAQKEWKDVFSGGEKQRMLFARILYAKPRFAVIDEGTSAVSQDVEGLMYETCKKFGVTLITISHRISLLKYHSSLLQIGLGEDGTKWKFEQTRTDAGRVSVQDEVASIKKKLAALPELRKRRLEVGKLLGLPEQQSVSRKS